MCTLIQLFAINSTTGRVSVNSDLSAILHQRHRVRVTVYDMAGGLLSASSSSSSNSPSNPASNHDVMMSSRHASRSNAVTVVKEDDNQQQDDTNAEQLSLTIQLHDGATSESKNDTIRKSKGPGSTGVPYVSKNEIRGRTAPTPSPAPSPSSPRRPYSVLGGQDSIVAVGGLAAKSAIMDAVIIVDASIPFEVEGVGGRLAGEGVGSKFGNFLLDNLTTVVIAVGCLTVAIVFLVLCVFLSVRLCNGRRRHPPAEQVRFFHHIQTPAMSNYLLFYSAILDSIIFFGVSLRSFFCLIN